MLKPILFFDVETTGLDTVNDRIVELYARKLMPDGTIQEYHQFYNPRKIMSDEVIAIHHITNEQVANCPTFAVSCKQTYEFFSDCYICGHNICGYDVLILQEEFARCDYDWPSDKLLLLDTYRVEKVLQSHSLIETYKRYFGHDYAETIGAAHGAKADTIATVEVFMKQIERLGIDANDESAIERYRLAGKPNDNIVDFAGNLVLIDDKICYNFGKNRGLPVVNDLGYATWMLGQNFSSGTKHILRQIIAGRMS